MAIVYGSIVAISLRALSSRRGNYTGDGMDGRGEDSEDDRGGVAPSLNYLGLFILLNRITIKRRAGGDELVGQLFIFAPHFSLIGLKCSVRHFIML